MLIFFSHRASAQSFSQFYLSEVWDEEGGAMPVFYRNSSTTDAQNNVYVVGSTTNAFTSNDILVQKFSQEGELDWTYIDAELPDIQQFTDATRVNRWKVTATYNFEIPEGYEVIAAWGRGSASQNTIGIKSDPDVPLWHWITLGVVGSLHEHFLPAEPYVEVLDFDDNSITVAGYIYEIYDDQGVNQLGWYPVDNNDSNVTFAYSLYLNQLPISTGLVENDINQIFNIYPNPTDKGVKIQINADFNAQFIEITDISGNLVKTVLVGDNQSLYFSTEDLSNGLYFVNISDGSGFWSEKLIINK